MKAARAILAPRFRMCRQRCSARIFSAFNNNGTLSTIYDPFTTRASPAGGFIRDPFPNNRIPTAMFDPVGVKMMSFYPA
jgi:hypothetical protein